MKTLIQKTRKSAAVAAVSLAAFAVAPAAMASNVGGPHGKTFDWGAKRTTVSAKSMTVSEKRAFARQLSYGGSGSYICSPSGSGSKPRCFARR